MAVSRQEMKIFDPPMRGSIGRAAARFQDGYESEIAGRGGRILWHGRDAIKMMWLEGCSEHRWWVLYGIAMETGDSTLVARPET